MLRRLVPILLVVVGVVVAGLGVASATVWRADDVLVASIAADRPYVVTAAGVLEMGGAPVTVRAHTTGRAPVVLAVGRDSDVLGWVGQDRYQLVTGLSSWHVLAGRPGDPSATPSGSASAGPSPSATAPVSSTPTPSASAGTSTAARLASPAGSDMWTAQASGSGSATLTWPSQPGRWSLLVASPSGVPPTLELAWPRSVSTPYLVPCLVLGVLLVLVGATWWTRRWLADRRPVTWTPVDTSAVPAVTAGRPLTRRELRAAASGVGGAERRASGPATTSVPIVAADSTRSSAAADVPTTPPVRTSVGRRPGPLPRRPVRTDQLAAPVSTEATRPVSTGPTGPAPTAATGSASTGPTGPVPPVPSGAGSSRPAPSRPAVSGSAVSGTAPSGPAPAAPSRQEPRQPAAAPAPREAAPTWTRTTDRAVDGASTPPRPVEHDATDAWRPAGGARPTAGDGGGEPVPSASPWSRRVPPSAPATSTGPVAGQPQRPSWVPGRSSAGAGEGRPMVDGRGVGRPADPVAGEPGVRPRPSWLRGGRPAAPVPGEDAVPAAPAPITPGPEADAEPIVPPAVPNRADEWRRTWGIPVSPQSPDAAAPQQEEGR